MFHKILNATALPDYELKLHFETGEIRIFDAKPYIRGSWYSELGDEKYFKKVEIDSTRETVEWPNGQDLDPCLLYSRSLDFVAVS
jgi:hypothetical protein